MTSLPFESNAPFGKDDHLIYSQDLRTSRYLTFTRTLFYIIHTVHSFMLPFINIARIFNNSEVNKIYEMIPFISLYVLRHLTIFIFYIVTMHPCSKDFHCCWDILGIPKFLPLLIMQEIPPLCDLMQAVCHSNAVSSTENNINAPFPVFFLESNIR